MNNPVQPPATVALVGTLDTKGADHRWVVPHLGPTTSGTIGAQTAVTLDEAAARVQEMRDAAVAVNPDVIVLCHGGPIAEPTTPRTCSPAQDR